MSNARPCGGYSVASMRLAYKELEIDRKNEEKKLQNMEGKKREQAERLGMGFGNRRYEEEQPAGPTNVGRDHYLAAGFSYWLIAGMGLKNVCVCVCFRFQRRVSFSDVGDAGD